MEVWEYICFRVKVLQTSEGDDTYGIWNPIASIGREGRKARTLAEIMVTFFDSSGFRAPLVPYVTVGNPICPYTSILKLKYYRHALPLHLSQPWHHPFRGFLSV